MFTRERFQALIDRYDPSGRIAARILSVIVCNGLLFSLLLHGQMSVGPAGVMVTVPKTAQYSAGRAEQPGCITSEGRPPIWIFGYTASEGEVVAAIQKKESSQNGSVPPVLEKRVFSVEGIEGERFFISTSAGYSTYYLLNVDKPRILVTVANTPTGLGVEDQKYFKEIVKAIASGNRLSPPNGIPLTFFIVGVFLPRLVLFGNWWFGSVPVHLPRGGSLLTFVITPRLLIAAYAFLNNQVLWCCVYLFLQICISFKPVHAALCFVINRIMAGLPDKPSINAKAR